MERSDYAVNWVGASTCRYWNTVVTSIQELTIWDRYGLCYSEKCRMNVPKRKWSFNSFLLQYHHSEGLEDLTMIWKSTKRKTKRPHLNCLENVYSASTCFTSVGGISCRRVKFSRDVKLWKTVHWTWRTKQPQASECVLSFPIYIDRRKQKIKDIVVIKWRIVKQLKIANVWMDKALY